MKRCLFSNSLISNFTWKHAAEYTCYSCHEGKKNEKIAKKANKNLLIEKALLGVYLLTEKIKKKVRSRKIKIKVDSRVIENDRGPLPNNETRNSFRPLVKTEGLIHNISFHETLVVKKHFEVHKLNYKRLRRFSKNH